MLLLALLIFTVLHRRKMKNLFNYLLSCLCVADTVFLVTNFLVLPFHFNDDLEVCLFFVDVNNISMKIIFITVHFTLLHQIRRIRVDPINFSVRINYLIHWYMYVIYQININVGKYDSKLLYNFPAANNTKLLSSIIT